MTACDPYSYPSNCPYPNYGSGTISLSTAAPATSSQPSHAFTYLQNIFGTSHLSLIVNTALILLSLVPVVLIFQDYLDFRRLKRVPSVFLELTPPSTSKKTSHATTQLFGVLHSLYSMRSFTDRLMRRKQTFALEAVSTREGGIRYIARIPKDSVAAFQQTAASYLPNIEFKVIDDYLSPRMGNESWFQLLEFKLSRHFAFSLKTHDSLSQHDPIAYITGSLAKPEPGELLVMQMILTPASSKAANRVRNKLLLGEDPGIIEASWKLPFILALKLIGVAIRIFGAILEAIGEILRPSYRLPNHQKQISLPVTKAAQENYDKRLEKLGYPLFRVDLRAYIVVKGRQGVKERVTGFVSSLASFHDPGYQALIVRRNSLLLHVSKWEHFRFAKFDNRLPSMLTRNNCLMSSDEVSNIYHFPYGQATQTENIVKSFNKTLPAPVGIKQKADNSGFDVVLGQNTHHGSTTEIGLTTPERERHVYIIGGTGNGKTTMLQYAIVQDMKNNKGLAVVDPHGDLAETILHYVPEHRIKDVVYFNPDDLDYPIGLNLLELTPGLYGNALLREKDLITESVISVFRKTFSDEDTGGHRIEYVLRNAIHTALTVEGATLFTVLKLLQNATYRKKIVDQLEDEDLKDFWRSELGQAGNMQRVKMSAGITAKIGRFKSNAAASLILSQERSTIDFEDIINSGKILICNFSKGLLGEDVSELFGITILAKLQLASLRRARIQREERRPFFLYVDEFQNFATPSFVQMLSESRKYKLFMTMAEQSTSQQKDQQMVNVILANVGTVICFRTGNPIDERLMLPFFSPYVDEGEIANLSAFNFYARLSAIQAQEPLSGQTLLLNDEGESIIASKIIFSSREKYGQNIKKLTSITKIKQPVESENRKSKITKKKRQLQTVTSNHGEFPEDT